VEPEQHPLHVEESQRVTRGSQVPAVQRSLPPHASHVVPPTPHASSAVPATHTPPKQHPAQLDAPQGTPVSEGTPPSVGIGKQLQAPKPEPSERQVCTPAPEPGQRHASVSPGTQAVASSSPPHASALIIRALAKNHRRRSIDSSCRSSPRL
jgi:hypothetical protein